MIVSIGLETPMYRVRRLLICLVILTIGLAVLPIHAQDNASVLDWVPADAAAFVAVHHDQSMLQNLGNALLTAGMLEPGRVDFGDSIDYDDFFPLDLFDLEMADFTTLVEPWLDDELVFVYGALDDQFMVAAADFLLIFEARDPFRALSAMRAVLEGQDLPEGASLPARRMYRDTPIYAGDKAAFAFTPSNVMIGSESMIEAALDTGYGDAPHLTSTTAYERVRAGDEADAPIYAYVTGEAAAHAFSVLLTGSAEPATLFDAVGQALATMDNRETLESALLRGQVDAIGVSVTPPGVETTTGRAVVTVHTRLRSAQDSAEIESSLLNFIPRSAAAVQSGADANQAATVTFLGLPLANYTGILLAALPVPTSALPQAGDIPAADDLKAAFVSFNDALAAVQGLNLQSGLLDHLDGSYAVALIPRPNAPTPVLNTPYDLLAVMQADDAETTRASLAQLVRTYLAPDLFVDETIDGAQFTILRAPQTGAPVISIGAVDNVVIFATGSAAELALDARRGDNRLVDQARWQTLSGTRAPHLYVDINPYLNLIAPQPGGRQSLPFEQVGVNTHYLGGGVYQLELMVTTTPTS
ncbi:MAG: DUF3352 domain-containing protein [Anaerolineae bacterium]|nr:DUF3352 domain-containing protein [Anaerolineae bacterium]